MYSNSPSNYNLTKTKGFVYTFIGTIAWGFSGIFGEYLMKDLSLNAKWLTSIRMIMAGIILLTIAIYSNKEQVFLILKNKRDFLHLLIFSIFGLVFCQYTFLMAIYYSNAGTATVLQYLGPIFIILYICIKSMRLPTRIETLSILFAFVGVFLISTNGNIKTLAISKEGLLWGGLTALGSMLYILIPVQLLKKYSSIVITGFGMLLGGIFLFIVTKSWTYEPNYSIQMIWGLSAIIIIGTVIAYTLYLQGVKYLGPIRAGLLAAIEPVSAVIFSIIILKTTFTLMDILGIGVILFAVYLLSKS